MEPLSEPETESQNQTASAESESEATETFDRPVYTVEEEQPLSVTETIQVKIESPNKAW